MANTKILTAGDKLAGEYQKRLPVVLVELDKILVNFVNQVDGNGLLVAQPAFNAALEASGYNALNSAYVAEYEKLPKIVQGSMKARGLPTALFTEVDKATFIGIATADLQAFSAVGTSAMTELRLGLYRQTVSNQPFSSLVEAIKAATVGVDGKNSAMANHAYTISNTAVLNFGGEVLITAGNNVFDALNIPEGERMWEVVGPLDDVTRDECETALADPIRTWDEWLQHSNANGEPYVGGTPGGFNCRHQLFPVVSG